MWKIGTAIVLDGTVQQLSASVGLVKSVRIMPKWQNGSIIYWGNSSLDETQTPPVGVGGWLPAPTATQGSSDTVTEMESMNGIDVNMIYVKGTPGDVVLWSYVEQ